MQINDQKSSVDETDTINAAKAESMPTGLVKGVLNSVLSGKDSAVFVPKADNARQDHKENENENEKLHEQNSESAAATGD